MMCSISNLETARQKLQQYFNYPDFRPHQIDPLRAILEEQKNILALIPTGGGKSMLFTIPALVYPGLTVVVSPLVALMENQVIALKQRGIAAEYLSSDHNIFSEIQSGSIQPKILFLSPERFIMPRFQNWLKSVDCSLIALDEAHTYTQFGLSFRFGFRDFFTVLTQFDTQFLAVTATASETILNDLKSSFPFDQIVKFPAVRENLHLSMNLFKTDQQRDDAFLEQLSDQGHQLIYCNSRRRTEWLYYKKNSTIPGLKPYHAGITPDQKQDTLIGFLEDRYHHIVATTAFGMGIDKGDIDTVHHIDLPHSIEDYTQQVGRAGRDGNTAKGVLWISYEELINHHNRLLFPDLLKKIKEILPGIGENQALLDQSETGKLIKDQLILMKTCIPLNPPEINVEILNRETHYPLLKELFPHLESERVDLRKIAKVSGLTAEKLEQILEFMALRGLITCQIKRYELKQFDQTALINQIKEAINRRRQSYLNMIKFLFSKKCRHSWLGKFYGDEVSPCGDRCDNCCAHNKARAVAKGNQNATSRSISCPMSKQTLKSTYNLMKLLKKGNSKLLTTLIEQNYQLRFTESGVVLEQK